MRKRGERILGPYEQGEKGWRVIEVDAQGKRSSTVFETEDKAARYKTMLEAELAVDTDGDDTVWIERWNDTIAVEPTLPGVWRRKDGGFRIRGRALDPTGKRREVNRILAECETAESALAILRIETTSLRGNKGTVQQRGDRWLAYTRRNGKQVYVGSFKSEDDAWDGVEQSKAPAGIPVRLRVTAVYANGAERELREFPVTEDGLTGFETDDSEYIAFVTRADLNHAPMGSTADAVIPEGAPF